MSNLQYVGAILELQVKKLEALRRDGNLLFSSENWLRAVECYSDCITSSLIFPRLDNDTEILHRLDRNLMLAYSNRAEALLRLGGYEHALADADRALHIDSKHVKTLVRKGKAAHGLGLFEKACESFKAATEESPGEQYIFDSLRGSTIAYEQSQTGDYDLTDYFSKGCTGEDPFCADFVGPVEIRPARNAPRGRGLFATRTLEPGELVLVSNPLAVVRKTYRDGPMINAEHRRRVWSELANEVAKRIKRSRRDMVRLQSLAGYGKHEGKIPSMDLFRPGTEWVVSGDEESDVKMDVVKVVLKHRFEYMCREGPDRIKEMEEMTGLWILPAFANHSCAPNTQYMFVGNAIFFRASKHIIEGEELTLAYFHDNLLKDVVSRQALTQMWLFECKCERCLFEESLQPHLSKISEDKEVMDSVRVESIRRMGQKEKLETVRKLSKALDDLEAVIQSLGTSISPKQQSWIRAAFIQLYFTKNNLEIELGLTEFGSQSRLLAKTLLVDSIASIFVTPIALSQAALLFFEVDFHCTEDRQQLFNETFDRVWGIYRVYFGNLPDEILSGLIEDQRPPEVDLNEGQVAGGDIHSHVLQAGLETDSRVGTALVNPY